MLRAIKTLLWMPLALWAAAAPAADYPDRPVRIVVGYAAGSGVDIAARLYAKPLSAKFRQPFVIENRPGAASSVAAASVARAGKDGYTLFMASSTNAVNAITPNLGFDFARDFAPIALTTRQPFVLVASPSLGIDTVKQLVARNQEKPGEVFFASTGVGGTGHLTGELFNIRSGAKLTHVPYQGAGPIIADLIAGRIAVTFLPASTVVGHIEAGSIKGLATAGTARSPAMPNVPTMAEAGVPDLEVTGWEGLVAPAGTPDEIVQSLADAVSAAWRSDEILAVTQKQGALPGTGTPAQFRDFIASEIQKWQGVAASANLTR